MRAKLALLSLIVFYVCQLLDGAITWSHFASNINCDPSTYSDEVAFANALSSTWDALATDDTLAVFMLRTTGIPKGTVMQAIQGEFEIKLVFAPPDLFFFYRDKATAADLRARKDAFQVDSVEAVPPPVKLVREVREMQEQAKQSGAEQPALAITLSPNSLANEKESQTLAEKWENMIRMAQPQSQATFKMAGRDRLTLSRVQGNEMQRAMEMCTMQPEAFTIEQLPNFTVIDPVSPGDVTPIVRRLTGQARFLNNEAAAIVQSGVLAQTPLTAAGLLGQGEVVGIADSGLDDQSCFFNNNNQLRRDEEPDFGLRKVIQYIAFADGIAGEQRDHGTHVAGSVAGSSTQEHGTAYNGIAAEAKIHFFDIGEAGRPSLTVPGNLATGLFARAKEAGAAIHSNSWGASINRYTTSSRDVDEFLYDNEEFVILIAAGNSGPSANTVGSPATAKNSISVGASVNAKAGSIEDMASFSSRGPTADGRIKPDVVAPGHAILSAASEQSCAVVEMSGTSMATPVTAGSVALVRQYFREGWYPTGAKNPAHAFVPSGALLKAMVIHSGMRMTGQGVGTYPGNSQGFGRVDLDSVLKLGATTPSRGTLYVHGTKIGTGQKAELRQEASFAQEFAMLDVGTIKATLVWMDPSSAINANTNLVNDLDLVVICGSTTSYPNGKDVRDALNNVEMIEANVTRGALCSVVVTAAAIRQGETQAYALVVTGPFAAESASPTTTEAATTPTMPARPQFAKVDSRDCGDRCSCSAMDMFPIVDRATCEQAARELSLLDASAMDVAGTPRPEGCYYYNNRLYLALNEANRGNGAQGSREPLCKPMRKSFEYLEAGKCSDRNMTPIMDLETCGLAASELAHENPWILDFTPFVTNSTNRPEGCYYNEKVPGFALFLATNVANAGFGSQSNRHQICKIPIEIDGPVVDSTTSASMTTVSPTNDVKQLAYEMYLGAIGGGAFGVVGASPRTQSSFVLVRILAMLVGLGTL